MNLPNPLCNAAGAADAHNTRLGSARTRRAGNGPAATYACAVRGGSMGDDAATRAGRAGLGRAARG